MLCFYKNLRNGKPSVTLPDNIGEKTKVAEDVNRL